MNKKWMLLSGMGAFMLCMNSCNNDENNVSEKEEQSATMTVSVNFPGSSTRATGDTNATEDEAKITTVDVFIYSGGGSFLDRVSLDRDKLAANTEAAAGADGYTYSEKIATTTGAKIVAAAVNLPTAISTALEGKSYSALVNEAQTFATRTDLASFVDGFAMFSTGKVTANLVKEDDPTASVANNVKLQVARMVAKVTVEKGANYTKDGDGTLSDLTFAVNNFNTKMFLIQGDGANRLFKDPNWEWKDDMAADFLRADATNDYVAVNEKGITDTKTLIAAYASENTSKDKTKKELTRVTVRGKYIPNKVYSYNAGEIAFTDDKKGEWIENPAVGGKPATFWIVTPSVLDGIYYFNNENVAIAFAKYKFGTAYDVKKVVKYTDGTCYWTMFLNKGSRNKGAEFDVLRNEFFKCSITKIVAPGKPNDGIDDPDVTPDSETSLEVAIDVLNWNTPVPADYILE